MGLEGTILWVYIDESGDPGFNIDHGSTPLFLIASVVFGNEQNASACRDRIKAVRGELKLPGTAEFKFSKTSNHVREYFLKAVAAHDFFYTAAVFDKRKLAVPDLGIKKAFYQYVIGLAFEMLKPRLDEAYLEIDRGGGDEFARHLTRYIAEISRDPGGRRYVRRTKLCSSHGDDLIQLADMVCGAVMRSFKGDDRFRAIVKRREFEVRVWP